MRAQAQDCALVLGSATPSLACLRQIQDKHLIKHELAQRFENVAMPTIELIEIKPKALEVGFANQALALIDETLRQQKRLWYLLIVVDMRPACGAQSVIRTEFAMAAISQWSITRQISAWLATAVRSVRA